MADQPSVRVPLPGEVPFLPQNADEAAKRDALEPGLVPEPAEAPPAFTMSVGSPAADDALLAALETAHEFIGRVTGWKGEPDEKQRVLEITADALQAIAAPEGAAVR